MNTWDVPSDSNPTLIYSVTERPDTQKGGTYLHCTCPAWPGAVQKGGCKHVKRVASNERRTTGLGVSHRAIPSGYSCGDCNLADGRALQFDTMTDLDRHIERHHGKASEADRIAAERILGYAL